MKLDLAKADTPYRLGRLFAVLERLQRAALGQRNATIRDRFYASASATPERVFSSLIRNARAHSKTLRATVGGGLTEWFEDQITGVLSEVQDFPKALTLQEQARFALGYYHQREALNRTRAENKALAHAEDTNEVPAEVSITRSSVTNEKDAEKNDRTMGRKHIVPYGLYRCHGFISGRLANDEKKGTGFSDEDLGLLWGALENMFDLDRAAARGEMAPQALIVFKHESDLGNAPAQHLFKRVNVKRAANAAEPSRRFEDYEVTVDEADLPDGVTLQRRILPRHGAAAHPRRGRRRADPLVGAAAPAVLSAPGITVS